MLKIADHAVILAFKLASIGLMLILTVLLSKIYSPAEVGQFFIFYSAFRVTAELGKFGQDIIALRKLSRMSISACFKSSEITELIFGKLPIVIFISIVVSAAYVLFGILQKTTVEPGALDHWWLLPLVAVPFSIQQFLAVALQGLRRFEVHVAAQGIFLPGLTIIFLTGMFLSQIDSHPIWSVSASSVVALGLTAMLFSSHISAENISAAFLNGFGVDEDTAAGMRLFTTRVAAQVGQWLPVSVLGYFAVADDVALFSVALQFATAITLIQTVTNVRFAPVFARLYQEDNFGALHAAFKQARYLNSAVTIPIATVLLVLGDEALAFLGADYAGAYRDLLILILANLSGVLVGPVGYLLVMIGKEREQSRIFVRTAALAMSIGLVLMISNGRFGAVAAVSLMIIGTNLNSAIVVKRFFKTSSHASGDENLVSGNRDAGRSD